MLRLTDVYAAYGAIVALRGVTLAVQPGSIVALLGANGAGKTSTLRAISGLLPPSSGQIEFTGQRIDRMSVEYNVSLGIAHAPEGRQLFTQLTVLENLRLGAYTRQDRRARLDDLARIFAYFPILQQRQQQRAGLLSGGEQQMLVIGRALMVRPRLLLLDEPSQGLAPLAMREIFKRLATINQEEKLTILIAEQNANLALKIADYAYVLETGTVALHGTSEQLRQNDAVRRSYLGLR
ncbi:ABC transporter ATP-binding protein [soil metagenome]